MNAFESTANLFLFHLQSPNGVSMRHRFKDYKNGTAFTYRALHTTFASYKLEKFEYGRNGRDRTHDLAYVKCFDSRYAFHLQFKPFMFAENEIRHYLKDVDGFYKYDGDGARKALGLALYMKNLYYKMETMQL